jgi:hypothetical protein
VHSHRTFLAEPVGDRVGGDGRDTVGDSGVHRELIKVCQGLERREQLVMLRFLGEKQKGIRALRGRWTRERKEEW